MTVLVTKCIKRYRCYNVNYQCTFQVSLGNLLVIPNLLECFLVLILLEECQKEINCKAESDDPIDQDDFITLCGIEGYGQQRVEYRIRHDNKHEKVPSHLPAGPVRYDEIVWVDVVAAAAETPLPVRGPLTHAGT